LAMGLTVWSVILFSKARAEGKRAWVEERKAKTAEATAKDEARKVTEQKEEVEKQKGEAEMQRAQADELRERAEELNKALAAERSRPRARQLAADATLAVRDDAALAVVLAREAVLEPRADERAMLALRTAIAAHVPHHVLALPEVARLKTYTSREKSEWLEFSLSSSSLSRQGNLGIIPSGK